MVRSGSLQVVSEGYRFPWGLARTPPGQMALNVEPHVAFKQRVPGAVSLIRTGDTTMYGNLILESA